MEDAIQSSRCSCCPCWWNILKASCHLSHKEGAAIALLLPIPASAHWRCVLSIGET